MNPIDTSRPAFNLINGGSAVNRQNPTSSAVDVAKAGNSNIAAKDADGDGDASGASILQKLGSLGATSSGDLTDASAIKMAQGIQHSLAQQTSAISGSGQQKLAALFGTL